MADSGTNARLLSQDSSTASDLASRTRPLLRPGVQFLAQRAFKNMRSDISRVQNVAEISGITREARLYALKELVRRAGVTSELFRSWRIEFNDQQSTLYVLPGTQKRIVFRNAFWSRPSADSFRAAKAGWMFPAAAEISSLVPSFIVPFSDRASIDGQPLFFSANEDCIECSFDLPLAALLCLSRWEEFADSERGIHSWFPASKCLAFREGFLKRPVVDEYGLALEQALKYLLPAWRPARRRLRVKLSHDIDQIGVPFNPKSAIGHIVRRRRPSASFRDLLGWVTALDPTYLNAVPQLVQPALELGLDSAVYWKASPKGAFDSGYDPCHPKVLSLIAWLDRNGIENGVHPSYETFRCPERLRQEVEILRGILGDEPLGGRQHYLRWCPTTWLDWENCGLAYDSTLAYAEHFGFRAGTCVPYRPWLFSLNREAYLIEIPLIMMDVTLIEIMKLTTKQSLEAMLECLSRCRAVGGVFTLLWHNTSLIDPRYGDLYKKVLDLLVGNERFDWRAAIQIPTRDLSPL